MKSHHSQEKGQGLVEYALILVLVAIVVMGILTILGPQVGEVYSRITVALSSGKYSFCRPVFQPYPLPVVQQERQGQDHRARVGLGHRRLLGVGPLPVEDLAVFAPGQRAQLFRIERRQQDIAVLARSLVGR